MDVSCGGIHNLAIDSTGALWSWGCNDEKALGREFESGQEWLPGKVQGALAGKTVIQAVGGDSHSLALTSEGACYNWGTYRDLAGVLGFSKGVDRQVLPAQIEALQGMQYQAYLSQVSDALLSSFISKYVLFFRSQDCADCLWR